MKNQVATVDLGPAGRKVSADERARAAFGRKVPVWVAVLLVLALVALVLFSYAIGRYAVPVGLFR